MASTEFLVCLRQVNLGTYVRDPEHLRIAIFEKYCFFVCVSFMGKSSLCAQYYKVLNECIAFSAFS